MSHTFIVKVYFYSLPSSLKNPQLAASPCVGLSRWFQRNVLQNTLSSACLLYFPQEFFFKISEKIKSPGLWMKARFISFILSISWSRPFGHYYIMSFYDLLCILYVTSHLAYIYVIKNSSHGFLCFGWLQAGSPCKRSHLLIKKIIGNN